MNISGNSLPGKWLGASNWFAKLVTALAILYFTLLLFWFVSRFLWGDGFWWLFLANSFAAYLFCPLPLILLQAALQKSRFLIAGCIMAVSLWCHLFGLPFHVRTSHASSSQELCVVTYNADAFRQNHSQIIGELRRLDADVVALQELTPALSERISSELAARYPYQCLEPKEDSLGMGVISKYSVSPRSVDVTENVPFVLQCVDVHSARTSFVLINAHMRVTPLATKQSIMESIRIRNRQTIGVRSLVANIELPVIVTADLNATPTNAPYAILSSVLDDAWNEAGYGLGHTFPNVRIGPRRLVPRWLVRIDYIFVSQQWDVLSAETGGHGTDSDHLFVKATVRPKERTPQNTHSQ